MIGGRSKLGHWASRDDFVSADPSTGLQSSSTVESIATERESLSTCSIDERIDDVLARNLRGFDYLPVTGTSERDGKFIEGLLHAAAFPNGQPVDGSVRGHFRTLSERDLIGADASILSFIVEASESPCRLVVSGPRIVGLVGLADLQRLPVRAALFGLITSLEMTMAEAIRRFSPDERWIEHLSAGRQMKVAEEMALSKSRDGFVDGLLFTQFCDKRTIVLKSLGLKGSKARNEARLKKIEVLRNNVAHANDYAASPDAARDLCAIVKDILSLQPEIAKAMPG